MIEALHRTKFKFPGRQKIDISKKWGFTKFNADEFEKTHHTSFCVLRLSEEAHLTKTSKIFLALKNQFSPPWASYPH